MPPRDAAYYMSRLNALDAKPSVVGVNLGGAGEVANYTNINSGIDSRQAGAIHRGHVGEVNV